MVYDHLLLLPDLHWWDLNDRNSGYGCSNRTTVWRSRWYFTSQYMTTLESGFVAFLFMQVCLRFIGSRVGFGPQAVLFFMVIYYFLTETRMWFCQIPMFLLLDALPFPPSPWCFNCLLLEIVTCIFFTKIRLSITFSQRWLIATALWVVIWLSRERFTFGLSRSLEHLLEVPFPVQFLMTWQLIVFRPGSLWELRMTYTVRVLS